MQWIAAKSSVFAEVTKNYWQRVGPVFSRPTTTSARTMYYNGIRRFYHPSNRAHVSWLSERLKSKGAVDWRSTGVARVRNQIGTGSCSSHACATLLEMMVFRKYGRRVDISVHDLWTGSDDGINIPANVFDWALRNGVVEESDVPWLARKEDWCRKKGVKVYKMIKEVQSMDFTDDYYYALALFEGPIVVEIEAGVLFNDYSGGFYEGEDEEWGLHCVVVVALEFTEGGDPYFVCQNSYGTEDWGVGGFFYVPVFKEVSLFLGGYRVRLEEHMTIETSD